MHFRHVAASSISIAMLAKVSLAQLLGEVVLPMDTNQAAAQWSFDPARVQVVPDPVTKAPAFLGLGSRTRVPEAVFTSKVVMASPSVIEAEVRLVMTAAQNKGLARGRASLGLIQAGTTNRYMVTVTRGRAIDDITYSAGAVAAGSSVGDLVFSPVYTAKSISPLMDENVRMVLERRADQYPLAHRRTFRLRMEARTDSLRMYVNGRLIGVQKGAFLPAQALVHAVSDVEILSCRVGPLEEGSDAFVTVPLDDHCNARSPGRAPAFSQEPGRVAGIEGIPFIASVGSEGQDHLDVGPSVFLYRMGTMRDADARDCVLPPEQLDATRFTLRVPERPYRRAWVLAAYDGDPNKTPELTLRFYRPRTSWVLDQSVTVPAYQATSGGKAARRVGFTMANGKKASLWLIPVDLDAAALAAEPMGCIELTKAILPYRGWPDPAYYNAFPGGLPSGVHVYGLTLESAPVWAKGTGTLNGNLYTAPEKPVWRVLLRNLTAAPVDADLSVTVTDPYGLANTMIRRVPLAVPGKLEDISLTPRVDKYGLYSVRTIVKVGDFEQARDGALLYLPENTRRAVPTNSPWGLWNWGPGGHDTGKDAADNIRLNKALGAINNFTLDDRPDLKKPPVSLYPLRKQYNIGSEHYRLLARDLPAWSGVEPVDPEKFKAFAEEKGKEAAEALRQNPDLQYVNVFAENAISLRVTHGMSPGAMGQPWFDLLPVEANRIRMHWQSAKAAVEGVRKYTPGLKFIFGHGAANFAQPFLRQPDWDNNLFDGFGMDLPQFERMPERQPRATEPSLLYFLHAQMLEKGMTNKEVVHLESYFPPCGPMALSPREQAESVVRTAVLSMSLGTTKFMRSWGLFTSGDGWGGSHYGSPGVIDRAPEYTPKPAAAAYATMTRILDLARYDGFLDTGSRSAFCLRFRDGGRTIYAVWTLRGTRPLEIRTDGGATVTRYDAQDNAFPVKLKDGQGTVTLDTAVQWLVLDQGAIASVSAGTPTFTERPAPYAKVVDKFDRGWTYVPGVYERYQNNHWDMPREPGTMQCSTVDSVERRSKVFRVELTHPDEAKPMVGFYGIFEPSKPIAIAGKAQALGAWVNGHSAWNRFIYQIVDAKGETWISCGTKDAWNCDDIHSWSSINHDGWRYMRFPLPGNAPGDNYRECENVWWGSDAEGVLDLPVKLTRVMVEMRPQMIYVDKMLPVPDLSIEMDDLTAEYADAAAMTDAPVKLQRAAAGALMTGELSPLPNPYADLRTNGVVDAPVIDKLYPPEGFYNGTRLFVEIKPVTEAKLYKGYVSAHADGRGAQALAITQDTRGNRFASSIKQPNIVFFDGLRAATPMYIFVTTVDAAGKESKPSAIREVVLRDEFPFK